MKHEKMKKLTVLAMLSAIAYIAVALLRFPVVLFLSYEPKDVIIAIGCALRIAISNPFR